MASASMPSRRLRSDSLLGIGFLVLGLFVVVSVLFVVRQQSDDALLRRALETEVRLSDVLSELQEGEAGQRGFLLTGDEAFLTAYEDAVADVPAKLDALRSMVDGNAVLAQAYAELRQHVSAMQADLEDTIALYRRGDRSGALDRVRRHSGKQTRDGIRIEIAAMDGETDRLVAERQGRLHEIGVLTATSTAVSLLLMGCVALAALREGRRRAMLTRFLPAEIAPRLAAGEEALLRGMNGPAAIAFVDLRGSTGLAESAAPDRLSAILSRLRSEIGTAARASHGVVDKFIGDGALIAFGLHRRGDRASADALSFARGLLEQLDVSGEDLDVGMGIHYGDVFYGVLGDAERLEFTVLGDTVNVASRLERLTRRFSTKILVSEAVLRHAREDLGCWQLIGTEALPGRREPVTVYAEGRRRA